MLVQFQFRFCGGVSRAAFSSGEGGFAIPRPDNGRTDIAANHRTSSRSRSFDWPACPCYQQAYLAVDRPIVLDCNFVPRPESVRFGTLVRAWYSDKCSEL